MKILPPHLPSPPGAPAPAPACAAGPGDARRRCRPRVEWLEDRTLLANSGAGFLADVAIPIALGSPTTGTLAAGNTVYYQINPSALGKLVAQVDAGGIAMRLSLLDAQNQVLVQSDAQSPSNPDAQIAVDIPAGPAYLEVENLGARERAYTLTAALTPVDPPQTLPTYTFNTPDNPEAIVSADFNGDGRTDVATVNSFYGTVSVYLGIGDGTFQPAVTYGVGNDPVGLAAGRLRR